MTEGGNTETGWRNGSGASGSTDVKIDLGHSNGRKDKRTRGSFEKEIEDGQRKGKKVRGEKSWRGAAERSRE